jgi:hypothetical protein
LKNEGIRLRKKAMREMQDHPPQWPGEGNLRKSETQAATGVVDYGTY